MKKNFLITGANLINKGAESMLLVSIDEIKKCFPESNIYFADIYNEDISHIKAIDLYYSPDAQMIVLNGVGEVKAVAKCVLRAVKRLFMGKKYSLSKEFEAKKVFPKLDAVLDVSGYSLADKWNSTVQTRYLNNIRLAKKYSIPIYLMPQSFGPFNYSDDKKYLLDEMRELLPYPKVIFAREKEGKQLLEENFGLKNVVLSTDLVLQNSGIDYENVFYSVPELHLPVISDDNNVGIIPNKQCFKFGDNEAILKLYEQIIYKLLSVGKNVYLFRHSFEDLEFCYMIKERFADNDNVVVLDNDLSCLEYDAFVRQFDFIVCSRFHGIVHAYRNGVPCIALGWAVKYKELTENVSQGQFVLNIADDTVDAKHLDEMVSYMLENYKSESEIIKEKVAEIQKSNCFSVLEELK